MKDGKITPETVAKLEAVGVKMDLSGLNKNSPKEEKIEQK